MAQLHYTERVDQLMGFALYRHRTLRTLFDCHSAEWDHTDMQRKQLLLELLIDSNYPLCSWLHDYKNYYTEELANKRDVASSIPYSLVQLYKAASPDVRHKLFKALVRCYEINKAIPQLNDIELTMQTAKEMYG
jgi:hypothetical protein